MVLVIESLATGVVTEPDAVVVVPFGAAPDVFAVFVYDPARSAATTVWVAGQVIVAPGASETTGAAGVHVPSAALASVTATFVNVAVPALVTVTV